MSKLKYPQKSRLGRLWFWVKIVVSIVITGGCFLIGLYTFVLPLVSVVASDTPLNPSNIFSTPFIVSHVGYLPIRHVGFICYQNDIKVDIGEIKHAIQRIVTEYPVNLGIGQQTTVGCPLGVGGITISSADIAIIVCYRPWYIPWQKQQIQRFMTLQKSDGTLRWYPVELDKDFNRDLSKSFSKCNPQDN